MAANKIMKEFRGYMDFIHSGFKYNLQVFPDTFTASALLFTLLFQSPPFASLSGSILLLNLIHPHIAKFFASFVGEAVGRNDSCTGRFPGLSFTRMTDMSSKKKFGSLDDTNWPSYYSVFLGFLSAYAGALPIVYNKELTASPRRNVATIVGLVVLALVVLTCIAYRIVGGCDSLLASIIGLLVGAVYGIFMILGLSFISERRLTNILGLPLIRDKTTDGKPIYVCERT